MSHDLLRGDPSKSWCNVSGLYTCPCCNQYSGEAPAVTKSLCVHVDEPRNISLPSSVSNGATVLELSGAGSADIGTCDVILTFNANKSEKGRAYCPGGLCSRAEVGDAS